MQELLYRVDPNIPQQVREYYELSLEVSQDLWVPGYIVRQSHAQEGNADAEVTWDEVETENFRTLKAAEEVYERRRLALAGRGFTFSNMDPIFKAWTARLNLRPQTQSDSQSIDEEEIELEPGDDTASLT